jgi:hypothetical protein
MLQPSLQGPNIAIDTPIELAPALATPEHYTKSSPPPIARLPSPSLRTSSKPSPDHVKHIAKEPEILRSQSAKFANFSPAKSPKILGYSPPHLPNFASAPPHRSKISAPPGLQARSKRSSPMPMHSLDMPIAIPKPLIAQKALHFVPDTSLSSPESSLPFPEPQPASQIIPEPSPKCSAVIAIEELRPIAPVVASRFQNPLCEPSYAPAISTHRSVAPADSSEVISITCESFCLSSTLPSSLVSPLDSAAPAPSFTALLAPSLVSSSQLSSYVTPVAPLFRAPSAPLSAAFQAPLPLLLASSLSPALIPSSCDFVFKNATAFSLYLFAFLLFYFVRLFHRFLVSIQCSHIILRPPGEPPPSPLYLF